MTSLRRQCRSLSAAFLGLVLVATPAAFRAGRAATTEQIVVDHNSGLAIYGYDPVAYFTDRAPKPGRDDLEVKHAGVAWRFANEGNRAAFTQDPRVYLPQYGGHDPVAIADGMPRAGHPDFWAIHDDKLYLFYSEDARKAFNADPEFTLIRAGVNWPHLRETLTP